MVHTFRFADVSTLADCLHDEREEMLDHYREERLYDAVCDILQAHGMDNVSCYVASVIRANVANGVSPRLIAHRILKNKRWIER